MRRLTIWMCLSALAACSGGSDSPPAPSSPATEPGLVAFTNAALWDGSGGDVLPGAVMLVRDGRIESITEGPAPATARIVDLGGRFVMPGLINTHGHVSGRWAPASITGPGERVLEELRLLARYGVTTINSLGGEPPESFAFRDEQDSPTLDRARLYVAGPVIADTDPQAARATATANAALDVDWLKLRVDDNLGRGEKMPWDAVRAVFAVAEEQGLAVATHIFYLDDALELLEMGSAMIAHSVRDQDVTDEFIGALGESGACYVPTLTREISTFVYAERPNFFDDPFFMERANREQLARVSDPDFMAAMADSEAAAAYREGLVQAMKNLRKLVANGAAVAFGTDSGPPGRFPGYFEHLELETMVKAGLTAEQALMSATLDAADCLGLDDLGTLEPGNWADFLVLDRSPVEEIVATKSLYQVYIAGNPVE